MAVVGAGVEEEQSDRRMAKARSRLVEAEVERVVEPPTRLVVPVVLETVRELMGARGPTAEPAEEGLAGAIPTPQAALVELVEGSGARVPMVETARIVSHSVVPASEDQLVQQA